MVEGESRMTATQNAADIRKRLKSDMELAQRYEEELEQQINDLDSALSRLKRLSSSSSSACLVSERRRSFGLSREKSWNGTGGASFGSTGNPHRSISSWSLSPSEPRQSATGSLSSVENVKTSLTCKEELCKHLHGLESALKQLSQLAGDDSRLDEGTVEHLQSVERLLCREVMIQRQHPMASLPKSIPRFQREAPLLAEEESPVLGDVRVLPAVSNIVVDSTEEEDIPFQGQVYNLAEDVEHVQETQDALLTELSNLDAALSRLKCVSHSFKSLDISTSFALHGSKLKSLSVVEEQEDSDFGGEEGSTSRKGSSDSLRRVASCTPIQNAGFQSSGDNLVALPADLFLLHAATPDKSILS